MARFVYKAKNKNGKTEKGYIEAKSIQEAHALLEGKNIYPFYLKEMRFKRLNINLQNLFPSVKPEELILFTEQFATLIASGLSILETLEGLSEQTENKYFKNVILNIKNDIENGSTIKNAFSKYKKVFPPIYLGLLEVGESSGTLDEVLRGIANYLEREDDIRKKVSSAFAYPKFVVSVVTAVVIFLLVYVLPKFVSIYGQAKEKLPEPTIILLSVSHFLTTYYFWLILLIVFIIVVFKIVYSIKRGRYIIDKLKIKIPIFGKISKFSALSRFVHSLSLVLRSGIDIVKAIEIAGKVTDNLFYISELSKVNEGIKTGLSFSEALNGSNVFPKIMVQMVAVGEKSGKLDDLLDKLGELWDRNIDHQIKNMSAKIEPTMIIILGVIVGFIALAMYLPMFGLPGAYKKTL